MNECYKFLQDRPLFYRSLYQPKINTCQFFTFSANLASLYKPTCYPWPQSASVMSLLSGFAAAVKCQVKCHKRSIQHLGRRNGKTPVPGQVGTDVTLSPEPQNTVREPMSWHHNIRESSVRCLFQTAHLKELTPCVFLEMNTSEARDIDIIYLCATKVICLLEKKKTKAKSTKNTHIITKNALFPFTY